MVEALVYGLKMSRKLHSWLGLLVALWLLGTSAAFAQGEGQTISSPRLEEGAIGSE